MLSPSQFRKFLRLPFRDRMILIECVVVLAFASTLIAVMPFRYLARFAARPVRHPDLLGTRCIKGVKRVRWAILSCASFVPWRVVCFQQGLAAQMMLRRRSIPTVLYYGATLDAHGNISAHVWLRCGDIDVIGCEAAHGYPVLASFPEMR